MRESGWSRSWSRRSTIWERMRTLRPSWLIAAIWMEKTCGGGIKKGGFFFFFGKPARAGRKMERGWAKLSGAGGGGGACGGGVAKQPQANGGAAKCAAQRE